MILVLLGFLWFVFGNWFAITTGLIAPLEAMIVSFALLGAGAFVYARVSLEASLKAARTVHRSGFALSFACPYCETAMQAFRSGIATCLYCETPFRVP